MFLFDTKIIWGDIMDFNILLSAIIGGLFVLSGSFLESVLSSRKNKEHTEKDLKLFILRDLMGNRMGLSDVMPEQNGYRMVFMSALNQVPVVFNKNSLVIEKFNEFSYHLSTKDKTTGSANDLLYELVKAIFEDLDMEMPSREVFFRTLF